MTMKDKSLFYKHLVTDMSSISLEFNDGANVSGFVAKIGREHLCNRKLRL